jgi:glycopeptide antibiotics resistance protein
MIWINWKQPTPMLWSSVMYGWVSWLLAFAIWMFLDPGGTAPFNRPTAYILFSGFYSVVYLLDYLIFVPLTYAVLTILWPTSRPWQWAVLGGVLFALSVPLWEAAFDHDVRGDTIFGCVLGTISGATAFYMLRRSNPSSQGTI